MSELRVNFFGRRTADFSLKNLPNESGKTMIVRLQELFAKYCVFPKSGFRIFVLRTNFTDTIVDITNPLSYPITMSESFADGAYTTEHDHAIVFFPGDCLACVAFHKEGHLALMHIGYKSLFDNKGVRENTILDSLFIERDFPKKGATFKIGWGIGGCCYGVEHLPSVQGIEYTQATTGPREKHRSIDLRELVVQRLRAHGIERSQIEVDRRCTACAGKRRDGRHYYSNTYGDSGRNLITAYFSR